MSRWHFTAMPAKLSADAAAAHQAWRDAGGAIGTDWPEGGDWGLIVDGLFGIGLTRPVAGKAAQWIARANASARAHPRAGYSERAQRRHRRRLSTDDSRPRNRDVHRAQAGLAHRGRTGLLRADRRACAGPRRGSRRTRTATRLATRWRRSCPSRCAVRSATCTRAASARWVSSAATTAWSAPPFLPPAPRSISAPARSGSGSRRASIPRSTGCSPS